MRTISIRLDDHTDSVLASYCARHGVTQTNAVKAAIDQLASAHRPTPADIAAQLGLVGVFHSGEGDLGANHSARLKERLRTRLTRDSLDVARPLVAPTVPRTRSPRR